MMVLLCRTITDWSLIPNLPRIKRVGVYVDGEVVVSINPNYIYSPLRIVDSNITVASKANQACRGRDGSNGRSPAKSKLLARPDIPFPFLTLDVLPLHILTDQSKPNHPFTAAIMKAITPPMTANTIPLNSQLLSAVPTLVSWSAETSPARTLCPSP